MVKKWTHFNESEEPVRTSGSKNFSHHMAQEIIWYFSENSKVSKELERMFYEHPENDKADQFTAYETSYSEYKKWIRLLMNMVRTKSLSFKDDMIELYEKIREERKGLPEIYVIEDILLDFIENEDYSFSMECSNTKYLIKLYKEIESSSETTIQEFIKNISYISKSVLPKFRALHVKVKLEESKMVDMWYNDNSGPVEDFNTISFKIFIIK